ncbi:MAG: hypothetical protein WC520_02775 [Candidatus Paceibacterota bacterium]
MSLEQMREPNEGKGGPNVSEEVDESAIVETDKKQIKKIEMSPEQKEKVGDRVLDAIFQMENKIEELESEKKKIIEENGTITSPDLQERINYIDKILPLFEARLIQLEGFAGLDTTPETQDQATV